MSEHVLETDFPLMVPPNPPSVGGVTRTPASASNTSSLSRPQPGGNPPPAYNSGSRSSQAPSNAIPGYSYGRHSHHGGAGTGSDWQYRGSSMTRTVTATSNFLPQPVPLGSTVAANPAIGRSGSLKQAYGEADDDSKETEPLYPTTGKRASPQSATSDYHSDGLNTTTQSDSMRRSKKARTKSGGSSSQGGTMNR